MAKYIKLEDAINGDCMLIDKIECDNCPFYDETRFVCEMVEWLESLSTTDIVSSAEKKRGEWIDVSERGSWAIKNACDQCSKIVFQPNYNYCPNCGADMRGDTE